MERPKAQELDILLGTVEEIRRAQLHIADLKRRLSEEALNLAKIPDRRTRIASAAYAYWFAPEAHAADLAFGAIGHRHPSKLLPHVGAQPAGIECDRCKIELEIASREQMRRVLTQSARGYPMPEGYRILCADCREAVYAARHHEHERERNNQMMRAREIRAMSYSDYLETEDWQGQCCRHLRMLLRMARKPLACEACSARSEFGIYHRTLDNLGESDDLILLCDPCMMALMGSARLAGQPGEGNRIGKALVNRVTAEELEH